LKKIQTEKEYRNEEGQTPEDWLTTFLTHLEKHNQVIDDYQGSSSIAYNLGAWLPSYVDVPVAYWYRDSWQARLDRCDPRGHSDYLGARARVRVV
jgi:hypothetical protein